MVQVIKADITAMHVGAVVNAANPALLGGGGVDGAIHRAAGAALLAACLAFPAEDGVRCPTGEARITPGFQLPARYVIHTVGPVWQGGNHGEAELLAACYHNSLALAEANGIDTIAFPAISCGVYGYPVAEAAQIAVGITTARQRAADPFQVIYHVCFGDATWQAFLEAQRDETG